jgi:iron complex outermembrane recepter protein
MQRSFIVCTVMFLLCAFSAIAQDKKTVSGSVLDETGSPLIGVSVQEKGTTNGTLTQDGGKYHLSVHPGATLVFTYIGYLKQEAPAGEGQTIKLAPDTKGLNEVVVTALGIKKESRALGYAVSTISAKEITQTGASNFASALYGKAAGVKVVAGPGGASSAVSIQVRGVSSVGQSTQPLYVVDGVPIRNYNDPTQNQFGTTNSRIDGNGILDINPEDIETMTILKGASASALYGSEATNGVVVITTKKGTKSRGLGVDLNYIYTAERLAQSPDYQNTYGPGYDPATNLANGATADGWYTQPDGTVTPYYGSYAEFGPKFDGRQVKYWDGSTRSYSAKPNNYRDFFDKGYNSVVNAAISNASDKGNFRLSYTRTDYKSIMPGSNLNKNNFQFNGTLKLNNKVSIDLVSSYNNNYTHNRPYVLNEIFGSYGGFFNRMDDMNTFRSRYRTTEGYKYVAYNNTSFDADQRLPYRVRATQLMDYYYTNLRDSYNESQNRFINSATLNYDILNNLKFRLRVGDDYTGWSASDMEHNTQPSSLGFTGKYQVENRVNNVVYGDALLTYNNQISKNFGLTLTGGASGRRQKFTDLNTQTTSGLVDENWFVMGNSAGVVNATTTRAEQVDVAAFGIIGLDYKSLLYAEITGREEATSTLPTAVNNYFYPSVNAGFVLSDAVKLPTVFNYAKLRASYSFVGNHPNAYQSNVLYQQIGLPYGGGNVLYQTTSSANYGNEGLKSEQKRESEFGLETRLLNNIISVDAAYYNNKVSKQILTASVAPSNGATSMLVNAGDMTNSGFELSVSATPVKTKNFSWTTRFNFATNKNKLTALAPGLTNLTSYSGDGGYIIVRADVGDALGNIYVHPRLADSKGNWIVDSTGQYNNDLNQYKKVGNIMPKVVGGFSNTVSYKNWSFDFTLDYRFGGQMVSVPTYYQIGAGMYKTTLKYRDAAHGGISYNVLDAKNAVYQADPNGTQHDGVILKGVKTDGTVNDKVISASAYYFYNYQWETTGDYSAAVYNNSYIKLREAAITYNMPKNITEKLHFQGLQIALIGRNLFYFYKTLPHGLDPETAVGSTWLTQGIDNSTAAPTRSFGASLRARF